MLSTTSGCHGVNAEYGLGGGAEQPRVSTQARHGLAGDGEFVLIYGVYTITKSWTEQAGLAPFRPLRCFHRIALLATDNR